MSKTYLATKEELQSINNQINTGNDSIISKVDDHSSRLEAVEESISDSEAGVTKLRGFEPNGTYKEGELIAYQNGLYTANSDMDGSTSGLLFTVGAGDGKWTREVAESVKLEQVKQGDNKLTAEYTFNGGRFHVVSKDGNGAYLSINANEPSLSIVGNNVLQTIDDNLGDYDFMNYFHTKTHFPEITGTIGDNADHATMVIASSGDKVEFKPTVVPSNYPQSPLSPKAGFTYDWAKARFSTPVAPLDLATDDEHLLSKKDGDALYLATEDERVDPDNNPANVEITKYNQYLGVKYEDNEGNTETLALVPKTHRLQQDSIPSEVASIDKHLLTKFDGDSLYTPFLNESTDAARDGYFRVHDAGWSLKGENDSELLKGINYNYETNRISLTHQPGDDVASQNSDILNKKDGDELYGNPLGDGWTVSNNDLNPTGTSSDIGSSTNPVSVIRPVRISMYNGGSWVGRLQANTGGTSLSAQGATLKLGSETASEEIEVTSGAVDISATTTIGTSDDNKNLTVNGEFTSTGQITADGIIECNDELNIINNGTRQLAFENTSGTLQGHVTKYSSGSHRMYIGNNSAGISGTQGMYLTNGNVSGWTHSSDARAKEDVKNITYGLDSINALRPVEYNWKEGYGPTENKKDYGFIAQEVHKILPFAADTTDDGVRDLEEGDEIWGISEEKLIAPLVKAVQELSAKVDEQAKEIEELKAR